MPSSRPSTPPASESTTLSVSSWRTMRPREPPMAARIAISRRRPVARDEQQVRDVGARDQQHEADGAAVARGATFGTSRARARRGSASTLKLLSARCAFGNFARNSVGRRLAAAPSPAPASRRASAGRPPGSSAPDRSCSDRTGTASRPAASGRTRGSRTSPSTPMIVYGSPPSEIVLPTMSGSPLKRVVHRPRS